MRKFLTMTAIAMMATTMTFGLMACGSDDDDGSEGGSLPSPTLTAPGDNKLQLSKLSGGVSYTFGYDENGTLTSIGNYDFTGSTFKHIRH